MNSRGRLNGAPSSRASHSQIAPRVNAMASDRPSSKPTTRNCAARWRAGVSAVGARHDGSAVVAWARLAVACVRASAAAGAERIRGSSAAR